MALLDLTQPLGSETYTPPGFSKPRLERVRTLAAHGLNSTLFEMRAHTGTHVDAPLHTSDDGIAIDEITADRLVGTTVVWELPISSARAIEQRDLEGCAPALEPGDFLLLSVGWARYFAEHEKYLVHPWLDIGAARWLGGQGIRLLGMDTPTPDLPHPMRPHPFDFPVHHELLDAGILIVENLGDLASIANRRVRLFALPIRLVGADGAPARVLAEY